MLQRKVIRPDLILSYWLFIWYILYIIGFTNNSPKLFLIIAILENFILLILKLINNEEKNYL